LLLRSEWVCNFKMRLPFGFLKRVMLHTLPLLHTLRLLLNPPLALI
jgi:hypothetical protein